MKHIIRSVQQNKAKEYAMVRIDNETGLWLSDWAQKILPVEFREGQKSYFGKKGMSMHIDCFFYKNESGDLKKKVYHTVIQKCDQDAQDTL